MGSVWDRASEVLAGRGGMLAGIAVPTLFVPTLVRDAYVTYATPGTPSFALIGGVLSIIVLVITIWGQLAIIAAASDPAADRRAATQVANHRLLPAIGVSIVLGLAAFVTLLPAVALLVAAGIDFSALGDSQKMVANVSGGKIALVALYMTIWSIVALFVSARLAVWQPVLVNERNGLRAVGRSWALTRGSTWRIIGVLILFSIVLIVATLAAQSVIGLVFRLILGPENIATSVFLGGIAASAVSAVFIVIAIVFIAQLYAALAGAVPRAATVAP